MLRRMFQGVVPLLPVFTSGTANLIVGPTNLGETWYKKGFPYKLAATIVGGNLY